MIGCEVYVSQNGHRVKSDSDRYNHLVLLCETQEGYKNLIFYLLHECVLHILVSADCFELRNRKAILMQASLVSVDFQSSP